ncbi:hypothetical protein GCM10011521_28150 [Arenimonas soli]|uniref:Uncharacterized protein n=1 Tax=Arenimonas soli TaxID=2269504 RepID=A0ABQ1HU56_9GAMM|nr:hypothetical protein [Arenimonas soli]GGA88147.1 hypothetical protein GCM10011521_28150 [Arenimonas soli]
MYFSTRQYPEFRGLSRREQGEIALAATLRFDSRHGIRFLLGLGVSCLLGLVVGYFTSPIWPSGYAAIAGGLTTGFTLWLYLLWEINGNRRAAVVRHFSERR